MADARFGRRARLPKAFRMDQVSRPLLIALGATVAFLAVWLVALRPAAPPADTAPPAPTQATAQGGQAPAGVQRTTPAPAAPASTAPAAPAPAAPAPTAPAAPAPAAPAPTAPAAPAPAAPRPATAAAPAPPAIAPTATASRGARDAAVLRDIRSGKVVVLLFWNARGDDDRATRAAVASLDRRGGRVAVHVVPVSRVGAYPSITQGVTISQSPTTLVIGRDRRARVIAGLTERRELSQAVGDALARR